MTPPYPDSLIRQTLEETKTIAIIGASANTDRPVHHVMEFLIGEGYEVYPVNPGLAGKELLGRTVYASLTDIPVPVDMVDIFRASDAVPGIVTEALALAVRPKVIWMQLGIEHTEAAAEAESAGLTVIMNRCPAIEHPRLFPPAG